MKTIFPYIVVRCFAETVRYLHLQSGEDASWRVKVARWEISHSQFGDQPFLSAQDSPDCDVLKLQQVQSYLRDSKTRQMHEPSAARSKTCTRSAYTCCI